jgi:alkylresorcinol/alkylpyrone synthase
MPEYPNGRAATAPRVIATATAAPPYSIGPAETKRYLHAVFGGAYTDLRKAERMVDHTGIDTRCLSLPPDRLVARRSLTETNALYLESARALTRRAAAAALSEAGVTPEAVDLVIAVSCTGYAIPSLDVLLAHDLGFRPNVRRLPITELGCGGGAAGLALAADFVRARPGTVALVVSTELCSLTFQPEDTSWQNVVAAMLFGDAAAAAVVTDGAQRAGPALLAARSHLFPNTLDYMGFVLRDQGLHLIMSPEVADMVRTAYPSLLASFLGEQALSPADLGFYVLHPGGAKILANLRRYVGVPERWLAPAAEVLRRYGNVSSTTVLLVLDEVRRADPPAGGALGLLGSLGPGFCAELALLRWES